MKKYIVLSVNDSPDYLFHVPLCVWAWRKLDFEPLLFLYGGKNQLTELIADTNTKYLEGCTAEMKALYKIRAYEIEPINGYRSETITQVSRLYGACVADGYLMTSDIDMIPLSDYWKPDLTKLTVYGRDLTDYHYPIAYIGATSAIWKEIMYINYNDYNKLIHSDLDQHFDKQATKQKQWCFDQDLITERINESSIIPERVDRGTDKRTGYPIGRIDRSRWTLDHKQYIDAHLFHDVHRNDDSFAKTLRMLHTVWPNEDWKWFIEYTKEFKKLLK